MKHCTKCQNDKPKTEFYKSAAKPDGLQTWCKQCVKETQAQSRKDDPKKHSEWSKKSYYKDHIKNKKRINESTKKWYKNHPEKHESLQLDDKLRRYGLTRAEYDNLLLKQNFECAICHKSQHDMSQSLSIDHDHKTGRVRGLLCSPCNFAIGHLRDSVELALNAAKYLGLIE